MRFLLSCFLFPRKYLAVEPSKLTAYSFQKYANVMRVYDYHRIGTISFVVHGIIFILAIKCSQIADYVIIANAIFIAFAIVAADYIGIRQYFNDAMKNI